MVRVRRPLRATLVRVTLALVVAVPLVGCDEATGPTIPEESYEVATIGTLGGERGQARGVNSRNEVVGVAENDEGEMRAFRWAEGTMEELAGLGGVASGAYGINDVGWVVGEAEDGEGRPRAVLWTGDAPVDLGTLGGPASQALAINEQGQVVGRAQNAEGDFRPFLWQEGRMEELPLPPDPDPIFASAEGINDRGEVVGTWAGGFGQQALLWSRGGVVVLETPCFEAGAFDINPHRQIAGGGLSCPIATEVVPLFWEGDRPSEYLEPIGGLQEPDHGMQNIGNASAINARGQIVGWSDADPDVHRRDQRATLWYRDEVVDLGGEPDFPAALDVNEGGLAVGRSGGLPALFAPHRGDVVAGRGAGTLDEAVPRAAVPAEGAPHGARSSGAAPAPPGTAAAPAPGGRMGAHLRGSRAAEGWAARLCERAPVRGPPTVAEILAGCPGG